MIKKNVMNARFRCNDKTYLWHESKGEAKWAKKDLLVGDEPSYVFPFEGNVEYVEDLSKIRHWQITKDKFAEGGGVIVKVK